jgi:hypothetical protein
VGARAWGSTSSSTNGTHCAARQPIRRALTRLLEGGASTKNILGLARSISYEEGILADKQEVSVTGLGLQEVTPDGESAGVRSPPMRLILRGTSAEPLRISNDPAALR